MAVLIDQPTTCRENRSMTAATYRTFSRPDISKVSNPFAIWRGRFETAVEHVRGNGGDLPLTKIGRQATPSWACFESRHPAEMIRSAIPCLSDFINSVH